MDDLFNSKGLKDNEDEADDFGALGFDSTNLTESDLEEDFSGDFEEGDFGDGDFDFGNDEDSFNSLGFDKDDSFDDGDLPFSGLKEK